MEAQRQNRAKYLYKLSHTRLPQQLKSKVSEKMLKTVINRRTQDSTTAALERDTLTTDARSQFCECCHCRFVFGLTVKVRVKMVKGPNTKKRQRVLCYYCRCGYKTEFKHELLKPETQQSVQPALPVTTSSWSTLVTSKEAFTENKSKARAKKRKMGSLTNMLKMKSAKEKQKPKELDLFELMKK